MAKKKLQIFISSTYLDLEEERQAAVEAILGSKHIPAGMELFRAGNTSQWDTIKRWINESDIYMLILGGRYGSIEPKSGKSYTQLEYEYAIKQEKPIFAVILSDSLLHEKAAKTKEEIFETKNVENYKKFKEIAMSKMIKPVDDCKDIKLAIKDSISELEELYELVGWIRSNEGENGQLSQQLNETRFECSKLRNELEEYKSKVVNLSISEKLSSGREETKLKYTYRYGDYKYIDFKWDEIYHILGKMIYINGIITGEEIKRELQKAISSKINKYDFDIRVSEDEIIRLGIQLETLNLIKKISGKLEYIFTEYGNEEFRNKHLEKK